jgi:peptidoglycan/LPS O-acetylase OafA/YrhL
LNNKSVGYFFAEITEIPPVLQNSYFPSLDGLRGIAIIMVVFLHLRYDPTFFYETIFNGALGVLIFFVLSGFLISTLCIKEKVVTKNISLKNFYIRRALRIFPVAYLYIIVIIILNYVFKLRISYISILGAALYLMNFSSYFRKYHSSWHTDHFWSLSVEEQFYLFIPFILKKKFKVYLWVILSIAFVIPLIVCLQYFYVSLNNAIFYAFTHYLIKFQSIAVGCLFSVFAFKYSFNTRFSNKTKVITNIVAIFLLLAMKYDDFFCLRNVLAGFASSFLIGYIIITNITPADDFIFKFLNAKILKTIGVLSYSIYLWQEIFTSHDRSLPNFMVAFPYNIVCIITVSCLSYYFYERFFLQLKSKFSRGQKSKPIAVV